MRKLDFCGQWNHKRREMTRQISAVEADQRPGEEVLLAVPMKLKEAIVPENAEEGEDSNLWNSKYLITNAARESEGCRMSWRVGRPDQELLHKHQRGKRRDEVMKRNWTQTHRDERGGSFYLWAAETDWRCQNWCVLVLIVEPTQ